MSRTSAATAVVPASRYPHGYASVRSLSRAGVGTLAAVADDRLPVTASRFCDESAVVPPSFDLLPYRDALLELAARPEVRTVVPHRPQDTHVLAKYAGAFEDRVDLAVPPFDTLRRVHDRTRLVETAAAAGVATPETRLLGDGADWDADRVVKSRYNLLAADYVDGLGASDSRIVKTVKPVPAGASVDADALRAKTGHEPIVQEFVPGDGEYVFGALYDEGEAVATFQHRQLRADSYVGGGGVYRETVAEPALETAGRALLDALDWHGLACIEFVRSADTGEFTLIELNPRAWQSLPCAIRAGADFPRWYHLLATGRGEAITPGYELGVRSHYLYGELEHLVSVRRDESPFVPRPSLSRRTADVSLSVLLDPRFDHVRPDDPLPALRGMTNELRRALGSRLR